MDNITINKDGSAEFAASRTPAWHQLGTVVGKDLSVMDGARAAGLLDWNLRKVPLTAFSPADGLVEVPGKHVVLRDVPLGLALTESRALGVVGDRYTLMPQEHWLPFVEKLLGTGGGADHGVYVDAIGSLDGGRVVFVTLAFEGGLFDIAGFDTHRTYLVVVTSHDGSLMLTARPTYIRVVCENTVRAMLGQISSQIYRVKHTGAGLGAGSIQDAQEAIGLTFTMQSKIAAEAEKFLATQVTANQFEAIIQATFPDMGKALAAQVAGDKISKRSLTMAEKKREALHGLWNGSTVAGAGIGGTAWGAVNAIGEYVDWTMMIKNGDLSVADARAARDLGAPETVEQIKARAFAVTKSFVGI